MNQVLKHAKRVVIMVVGLTLVGIGIALLVLPGPGIVVIIAGLAILASEFVWAQSLLDRAKAHYNKAKNKVTNKKSGESPDNKVIK